MHARGTHPILLVHVSAVLNQQFDDFGVASPRCVVERCFFPTIAFIHRSTVLEQQSHDIDVPILRGVVQCCLFLSRKVSAVM
jgi:hypothetical protein